MAVISFARGVPTPECLPVEELAECARAAVERDGRTVLSYGPAGGYGPLRESIAERHGVEPGRILVSNGSLQGFVFLAQRFRGERVLVEDPYGLVRFEGEAPPTLFELDGGERVAYSSSFSKTIAPGLRVGYFVLPHRLEQELEAIAVSTYITPALLAQATVAEYLRRGLFEPGLERVRGLLRARRDTMLAAVERFPPGTSWSRPEGGYFLWLDLPAGLDVRELLAAAESEDVTFVPGTDFFPAGAGGTSSARLAYSFVSSDEIAT